MDNFFLRRILLLGDIVLKKFLNNFLFRHKCNHFFDHIKFINLHVLLSFTFYSLIQLCFFFSIFQNEESFFRQFISGFVSIWEKQLNFNFDDPPQSTEIKHDSGPHLNRLPDELLPAIGKFLIIARDEIEQGNLTCERLMECELLLKCLMIISRHFDNIPTIVKTDYVTNSIAIASHIIKQYNEKYAPKYEEISYMKSLGHFLEVLYDPYLSWRNFLKREFVDFHKLSNTYHTTQLNVEIVPFIYDCFQVEKIMSLPEVGAPLVHVLGAIISGSQVRII